MWPNGPCSASRWWSRNKEEENISPEGAKSKVDGEWERKSGRGRRNDSRGEFVTSRNIIWLKVKSEGSVNCEILFNSKPFWRLMWTSLLKAKDAVARSWVTLADSLPRVYFSVFQVTWFCCFSNAIQIFLGASECSELTVASQVLTTSMWGMISLKAVRTLLPSNIIR